MICMYIEKLYLIGNVHLDCYYIMKCRILIIEKKNILLFITNLYLQISLAVYLNIIVIYMADCE